MKYFPLRALTALATNPMYLKRGDGALVQIPKGAPVTERWVYAIVFGIKQEGRIIKQRGGDKTK